jgi:hypothetical protein
MAFLPSNPHTWVSSSNHDITATVTRLNTKIGLTKFRTHDLSRIRRALCRRTGNEWMSMSSLHASKFEFTILPRPSRTLPRPQPGFETNVECGSSSWAVTCLNTKIRLTGYRTRDLLHFRRALYRRVGTN